MPYWLANLETVLSQLFWVVLLIAIIVGSWSLAYKIKRAEMKIKTAQKIVAKHESDENNERLWTMLDEM